jgi:hypothetical protein
MVLTIPGLSDTRTLPPPVTPTLGRRGAGDRRGGAADPAFGQCPGAPADAVVELRPGPSPVEIDDGDVVGFVFRPVRRPVVEETRFGIIRPYRQGAIYYRRSLPSLSISRKNSPAHPKPVEAQAVGGFAVEVDPGPSHAATFASRWAREVCPIGSQGLPQPVT